MLRTSNFPKTHVGELQDNPRESHGVSPSLSQTHLKVIKLAGGHGRSAVRFLVGVGIGLVLAIGAWAQTSGSALPPVAVEKVDLQAASRPVGGLMARKMRERGEEPKPTPGDRIDGHLAKPGGDGPFPAVVVLPDCIGLTPFVRETLTAQLASWGYATLVVDSWTSRKAQAGCFLNGQEPPGVDRVADAYGGLFYLASQPFVQRDRVGLLGFATGGVFVLTLAEPQTQSSVVNDQNLGFRAGVVYYAPCAALELIQKPAFPLLILAGRDDRRTGVQTCEKGARPASPEGNPVEVHVYPDVKHGFADPHWGAAGEILGFPAAYDPKAAEDGLARTREFLDNTLGGKPR
jgi:dienelactone hydrolase